MSAAPLAVRMDGICKSFDGTPVLTDVHFEVEQGEVHALAGGNGAGKSTLMKILQGTYGRDAGTIELFGAAFAGSGIHAARDAGIGMVYQEFSLIPTLTVAQNIFLDAEPTRGGLIDDAAMRDRAHDLLERIGVDIDPNAEVSELSTAQWQLTEIAKALGRNARVLIMDEPTASLSKTEVDALFALIGRLKAQGISIVYISHRMDEIARVSDRITILRNGKNLLVSRLDEITPQEIVNGIAGRTVALGTRSGHVIADDAPVLLEVEDLYAAGVHGVTFDIRAGEILGIAGQMGSGRTELARALFGISPITSGRVKIHGDEVDVSTPSRAMAAGIALVPEDRRRQGLVLDHGVRSNLTLPLLDSVVRRGLVAGKKLRELADSLISQFAIAVARPDAPARLLSGGNQQKVVLAKWLATAPSVLVLDEPTAGVDVGTKTEIIRIVRELASTGKAVMVISSEYPELVAMCDRYLVLREGRILTTLDATEVSSEIDLEAAVQGVAV